MTEFLFAGGVFPFTVAIGIMFAIALLEGVGMLIGAGLSEVIESLLPDIDFDINPPDASSTGLFTKLLGWMYYGRVPVLIILVCFLTAFGLTGMTMQAFIHGLLGFYLPSLIAVAAALFASLPFTRGFTALMARILPKDETSAISAEDFIGKSAVITLGTARQGAPAEAKFTDRFGQTHYVMVEPDETGVEFTPQDRLILSEKTSIGYLAIKDEQ
ncbi:YqiJ family protein [Sulfurimonas sp. HSL-1656]|uniref:YqiJ family protein n=1 Tax=Thiomicrolovo subterrani TaxID=3131934 RepID=UPI0031F8ABCE